MSVRLRLTLWYTGLLGLILAGFAALVYFVVAGELASQLEHALHSQAARVAQNVEMTEQGPAVGSPVDSPCLVAPDAYANSTFHVQVLGQDGKRLATSDEPDASLPISKATFAAAIAGQSTHEVLEQSGERFDSYTTPLRAGDRTTAVLQIAAPLEPLEAVLAQLRLVLGGVVLLASLVAAGIGWLLATKAMRPVDRMARLAREIGQSADLSRRLAEPGQRDELGRLAATLNEMLARIEGTFASQRRFLAEASHELRTPLASIRVNVETLRRGASENGRERDEILRDVAGEAERMGRLVSDLLVLARADAGQQLRLQRLSLDAVVLDVYRQAKSLARGVSVSLGVFTPVEIEGDADRLRQLLLNLVDNALRYTPPGGVVTLDVGEEAGFAVLRVRDTGPGIPAEELPRVFERFYRLERSGTRGGTGLGLAISRWIAEAHGGRVEVQSREGEGSVFTVHLPLWEAAPASVLSAQTSPG